MPRYTFYTLFLATFLSITFGCAGPAAKLLPVSPLSINRLTDGTQELFYDTDGNNKPDYCERLSPQNIIVSLGYDTDNDGTIDDNIQLNKIPDNECRHLIVILDSVPFFMVQDIWQQGRLRYFTRPSSVISPFPVMTDLSLSEFFGTSPCPGIESAYYDGKYLTNAYTTYLSAGNVAWKACVDYRMNHMAHPYTYLEPHIWNGHELGQIQDLFRKRPNEKLTVAYMVSTSALGARIGRNGHQAALIRLDRFCQSMMYEYRGKVKFTLLSDHGHKLSSSKYIDLTEILTNFGYRVVNKLTKPQEVVVPQFGVVTCASIYTKSPERVTRDIVAIEGVDLAAYLDKTGSIIVLSSNGRARISKSQQGFSYQPEFGDPLQLSAIIADLKNAGKVDTNGFIENDILFRATVSHSYPDAVYRLWRAFNGLITHVPQVLVSVKDGWHCGSKAISNMAHLTGAHGNLNPPSSFGFIMTSAGQLPPTMRMENAKSQLMHLGVPLKQSYCTPGAANQE